ncbi:hypothetical protein KKB06_00255 [Patescibacteria group bacterium]|nr:hypothetical protein [Patescibacteria group bacterium]
MSLLVFHRGGGKSLGYPPNCFLTIKWAIEYEAKAVEYDVVYCQDNNEDKIIVIEPKLLKENGLDINNLSWQEVKKLNVGNEKFGQCSVATFEEIQALIPDTVFQQIHLKGENSKTIPTLFSKLENIQNYTLTSFDLEIIRKIKETNSNTSVGWIVKPQQERGSEGTVDLTALVSANPDLFPDYSEEEIKNILTKSKNLNINIVILCGPRIRDKQIIDQVKSAGFQSGAWGVAQNLEVAKKIISFDIDRFTIDNPEKLQ